MALPDSYTLKNGAIPAYFDAILGALLAILERSRNVVMHGGELGLQDIERIGGNIRDWVRQAG